MSLGRLLGAAGGGLGSFALAGFLGREALFRGPESSYSFVLLGAGEDISLPKQVRVLSNRSWPLGTGELVWADVSWHRSLTELAEIWSGCASRWFDLTLGRVDSPPLDVPLAREGEWRAFLRSPGRQESLVLARCDPENLRRQLEKSLTDALGNIVPCPPCQIQVGLNPSVFLKSI
ncbi:MAG: hypothetical protein QXR87_03345 [Candidatus Hadarchaeales archaeon]